MQRRSFLKNTSLALTTGAALLSSMNTKAGRVKEDVDLSEITISALQEKYAQGTLTAEEVVKRYLKRIEEIDKSGPGLNSVIELNPEAVAIAIQMDAERKQGKLRGPLHGVPVMIKDNIDTADKMQTTAGALAMEGNFAKADAFIVQKLRAAGAIIIGKTNLSEWANFRSTSSCSGWSSRGGQTKSPYILTHNPCGSSSGSGVAVAANLCTVAVGTETDGSVVCPAAVAGIVGLKPTVGLLSRAGIIPISSTQDTAGPMARTIEDAAILLGVLTSVDNNDSITRESTGKSFADYTKFLDINALAGKRIGIEKKAQGNNKYVNELFAVTVAILKKNGAVLVEIDYLDKFNSLGASESEVLQYEFKDGVNNYLANANCKVKSLSEVIEFNRKNEDKAMPYFKQELLESSNAKSDLSDKKYLEALENSHVGSKNFLDKIFADNQLDAICGITMGPTCSIDTIYGDRWGDYSLTTPAAISGYPHITVPCGKVYDLPVGLSFFGTAYTEGKLIGIAYSYEQASKKRVKPDFKTSFLG